MLRLALGFLALAALPLVAQDAPGPLISITSPDAGTTFAFGTVKSHTLVWNKQQKMLFAQVTFINDGINGQLEAGDDTFRFRLPGVTFDEGSKLFIATSAGGERVPIARMKKELFFNTIEVLPNAIVRIEHPRGNVTVVLEAVRPDDPALRAPAAASPDGTHAVDIRQNMQ